METKVAKPTYTESDLQSILVTPQEIQERVKSLGEELSAFYKDKDVTIVSVMSGALMFTADLIRACDFSIRLDTVRAESYGNSMTSQNPPRITNPLKTDIENRHVLVVDDILDSGKTLRAINEYLMQANPATLRSCVLLDKPARHPESFQADYSGFTIPDEFAVGYGLDFAERYRHLPCIGVLKEYLQAADAHV